MMTSTDTLPPPTLSEPAPDVPLDFPKTTARIAYGFLALGILLMLGGSYLGLFVAPPERHMGDVARIMYVHVPTAWVAMVCLTLAFVSAVGFLLTRSWKMDALLEASIEVGVLLAALLCVQGSIWAKPTWGVWWDWDPRLTTTAVMLFAFLGILALRRFVDDPERRGSWSAVATIVSWVDVPVVYFSVRWWNSLHQLQSGAKDMDKMMMRPLLMNALGLLALVVGVIVLRRRIALMRLARLVAPPSGGES